MSNTDIRDIKEELKQGLEHIEEALRLVKLTARDIFCVSTISAAKDLILEFIRTGAVTPKVLNDSLSYFNDENSGWNPMRSKFPAIGGFSENDCNCDFVRKNDRVLSESVGFCQNTNTPKIPMAKAELLKCIACDIKCNSMLQWKQHVNGYQHKARLAGEVPLQRKKFICLSNKESGFSLKMFRKKDKHFHINHGKVECNQPKGRRYKMKVAVRRMYAKRPTGSLMRCELCDINCNGNLQYIDHINGKRHQMAVEQDGNECTQKF